MSIIDEALKKAEKEKKKDSGPSVSSAADIHKIIGPTRNLVYKKEDAARQAPPRSAAGPHRIVYAAGGLVMLAIIVLTAANLVFVYSPGDKIEAPAGGAVSDYSAEPPVSEAYSAAPPGLVVASHVLDSKRARELFLSNFELSGIVYDAENSWAVINNSVVKSGDVLDGAKIVSIEPQRVVIDYRNEILNLVVK